MLAEWEAYLAWEEETLRKVAEEKGAKIVVNRMPKFLHERAEKAIRIKGLKVNVILP